MIRVTIEAEGVSEVAAIFARASAALPALVGPIVEQMAYKVKAGQRADMAGSGHFGSAAGSISYDMTGDMSAEVGPTKPAGAIANIAYFGGANGGGGTVRDPIEPAMDQLDWFEKAIGDAVERLLQ